MTGSAGATAKPEIPKDMRPSLFPHVLRGVDGKAGGYVAVEQAASLAGRDGRLTLLAVTSFRAAGAIRSPALGPARVSEILERAGQIAREAEVRYSGEIDPATPPAEVVSEWGVSLRPACARRACDLVAHGTLQRGRRRHGAWRPADTLFPCGAIAMEPEEI